MGLGRYLVDAVVLEGRSPSELARSHQVARSWIYELVRRYHAGGYDALEPRSRRPRGCAHAVSPPVQAVSREFCVGHLGLCGPNPINDIQAAGIYGVDVSSPTLIAHNHVSDSDVGIYLFGNGITESHNKISDVLDFGYGMQDGSNITVSHSSIEGGSIGVVVAADTVNTIGTIDHVGIEDISGSHVQTFTCCGFTATAVVNH
jgi:Helix-turn-helix domain